MSQDSGKSRKHAKAAAGLAGLNAELESKIEELARANVELYETARERSEFVANMSHELRTPLNSIIGFADVLIGQMKDSATPEQLKYLRNIRQGGYRLLETLSELMNFSRLESGKATVQKGPVFIPGLIGEVVANLENASARRIELVAAAPADMPTVMTDEIKVTQILHNLGSNAVKFTPDGGTVTLEAALRDRTLVLVVSDTGIGIPPEEQDHVFGRFRQGNSGHTRRYDGIGLGLYIVDALVRLLGGKLSLESAPGKGTKFTVDLPVEIIEV